MEILDEIVMSFTGSFGAFVVVALWMLSMAVSWICFIGGAFTVSWKWGFCCLVIPFPSIFIATVAFYERMKLSVLLVLTLFMAVTELSILRALLRSLYVPQVFKFGEVLPLCVLLLPQLLFALLSLRIRWVWGVLCLLAPFPAATIFAKRFYKHAKIAVLTTVLIASGFSAFVIYGGILGLLYRASY